MIRPKPILSHRMQEEARLGAHEAPDACGLVLTRPRKYPALSSLPMAEREAMIQAHAERVRREMARLRAPNAASAKVANNTDQKGRCKVLVVSRNRNQTVVISVGGIDIEVTLVAVKSMNAVRLGIQAPPEVLVLRKELVERAKSKAPKAKVANGVKPRRD
jgi:carbon storage regulator CsrA